MHHLVPCRSNCFIYLVFPKQLNCCICIFRENIVSISSFSNNLIAHWFIFSVSIVFRYCKNSLRVRTQLYFLVLLKDRSPIHKNVNDMKERRILSYLNVFNLTSFLSFQELLSCVTKLLKNVKNSTFYFLNKLSQTEITSHSSTYHLLR